MCYIKGWFGGAQADDSFTFHKSVRDLRFCVELAQAAKNQYEVLSSDRQSICESLLLLLVEARRCKVRYLSAGREDLINKDLNEVKNRHLSPLFADIEIDGGDHAAYLLRQLPQFQDWYDPKEGDVATVLHPDNRNPITREFYKGSWRDTVSLLNNNPTWLQRK